MYFLNISSVGFRTTKRNLRNSLIGEMGNFSKPFSYSNANDLSQEIERSTLEKIRKFTVFLHGDVLLFEIDTGARTICLRNCRTDYEIQVNHIVQTRYKFGTHSQKNRTDSEYL